MTPTGPLPFTTVLVANRGEIACRVIGTLRRLGIRSVAVFADPDAGARHVREADVAVRLGGSPRPATTATTPPGPSPAGAPEARPGAAHAPSPYLDVEAVVAAAVATGAEAVHPGYGFLSENPALATACARAGIAFVGPGVEALEAMADKLAAKRIVAARGVPVVPGAGEPGLADDALVAAAPGVGFPLLVKPSAGGGGKGMVVVRSADELPAALASARRVAAASFGDDTLLLERLVEAPRHVEVQVLADAHGDVVHLGERECSLQRRHQKVVEEAPSPLLTAAERARMGEAACEVARSVGYVGAGTVEFLVPGADPTTFFFIEMNTRLQVEHPVTEMVTGLDLVELQLRVAAGEPLPLAQADVVLRGHAVEARVYAESPARGFLPATGTVLVYDDARAPAGPGPGPGVPPGPGPGAGAGPGGVRGSGLGVGPASGPGAGPGVVADDPTGGVRLDSGISTGSVVSGDYDPMLAKAVAWAPTRAAAIERLDALLARTVVLGVETNVGFLRALLADDDVRAGRLDTGLIDRLVDRLVDTTPATAPASTTPAADHAAGSRSGPNSGDIGMLGGGNRMLGGPNGLDGLDDRADGDAHRADDTPRVRDDVGTGAADLVAAALFTLAHGPDHAISTADHAPGSRSEPGTGARRKVGGAAGDDLWRARDGWRLNAPAAERVVGLRDVVRPGEPEHEVRVTGTPGDAVVRVTGEAPWGELLPGSARAVRAAIEQDPVHDAGWWLTLDGTRMRVRLAWQPAADGAPAVVWLWRGGRTVALEAPDRTERGARERAARRRARGGTTAATDPEVRAAMPGTVVATVADGADVAAGTALVTVEAMKMEHPVLAPHDGVVRVAVRPGDLVRRDQVVAVVEPAASAATPGPEAPAPAAPTPSAPDVASSDPATAATARPGPAAPTEHRPPDTVAAHPAAPAYPSDTQGAP